MSAVPATNPRDYFGEPLTCPIVPSHHLKEETFQLHMLHCQLLHPEVKVKKCLFRDLHYYNVDKTEEHYDQCCYFPRFKPLVDMLLRKQAEREEEKRQSPRKRIVPEIQAADTTVPEIEDEEDERACIGIRPRAIDWGPMEWPDKIPIPQDEETLWQFLGFRSGRYRDEIYWKNESIYLTDEAIAEYEVEVAHSEENAKTPDSSTTATSSSAGPSHRAD